MSIAPASAREGIYRDVYSTDHRKIGDVIDYVLQFDQLPQLRYVIVQSGGVLGVGGDRRAIPADAITDVNGRLQVNVSRDTYENLPVMPERTRHYLAQPATATLLAGQYNTPVEHAMLHGDFVLFSRLNEDDRVVGPDGQLGDFVDLWIDFNANEAPYLEMAPTNQALLDRNPDAHYALPTTKLTRVHSHEIMCSMKETDLENVRIVDDLHTYVAAAGEKLEALQMRNHS